MTTVDSPPSRHADSVLETHGLDVRLDGHQILHGVDITVHAGETVALLGGNGSGKTTLVRALLGLAPSSPAPKVFGQPLGRFRDWHRVGYVPQRGQLQVANATVDEVVRSGRLAHRKPFWPASAADRAAVDRSLTRVNLATRRREQLVHLSGGQQQRALIARALASQPDLLVLDEPLAGLDLTTQSSLARLLGALKADGLAMLVVLHELGPLADLIDRSVVLRQGRVIHDGPLLEGVGLSDAHHIDANCSPVVLPQPSWHVHTDTERRSH